MHTNETRVSRAFRVVEGGADSHEDMNPPNAAGRMEVLFGVEEPIAKSAMSPAEGTPTSPTLSEAQYAAFWAGIDVNRKAAYRMAARFVTKHSAKDVVHTAAVLFVEDAERRSMDPEPFPATPDRLRRKFFKMVRNHALDCVRDSKRPQLPIHSHWGVIWEPVVRGRNVADRELDSVFARNDEGDYDAPTAAVRRDQDNVEQLHHILQRHLDILPQAQREILVESFFGAGKRAEIAARRGITESTYDNHRQAALKAIRESLSLEVELSSGIDRSICYDHIEELIENRAARLQSLSCSKKGKRPNLEGKSANLKGERANLKGKSANLKGKSANLEGKRDKPEGKGRNPRGERRNGRGERRALKGERSNSAHESGNNRREGAADEPLAGTSPAARKESASVRRSA